MSTNISVDTTPSNISPPRADHLRPRGTIQAVFSRLKLRLFKLLASSERLTALYYGTVNKAFWQEFSTTLNGRLLYLASKPENNFTSAKLRRNIHRLEKGLIMRPRRSIFGLDYLQETVSTYALMLRGRAASTAGSAPEIGWAHDVLSSYFQTVGECDTVKNARSQFVSAQSESVNTVEFEGRTPYPAAKRPLSNIDFGAFRTLCHQRRSIRWYKQEQVPREKIDNAIEAASSSPSACNRQPFQFRVIDDQSLLINVRDLPGGTGGFSENFPAMIVVVGQLRCYPYERDRHLIYIDASLAAMTLMFALETQGISSCPINWSDTRSKNNQMGKILELQPDERVIMCLSLGYADPSGCIPYSGKKSVALLRRYNLE